VTFIPPCANLARFHIRETILPKGTNPLELSRNNPRAVKLSAQFADSKIYNGPRSPIAAFSWTAGVISVISAEIDTCGKRVRWQNCLIEWGLQTPQIKAENKQENSTL